MESALRSAIEEHPVIEISTHGLKSGATFGDVAGRPITTGSYLTSRRRPPPSLKPGRRHSRLLRLNNWG